MVKIPVSEKGSAYFCDDLREAGYTGDLKADDNACVLVIRKPGSNLKDGIKSLKILIQDWRHRVEMGEE